MLKYTNRNIRKSYRYEAVLTVAGAVLCLIGILLFVTGFYGADKAKNNVRPIEEILSENGNHAAKPAFIEISRLPVKVAENEYEDYYLVTDGREYYISGMTEENYARIASACEASGGTRLEGVTKVIIDEEARNQIADAVSEILGKEINEESLDSYVGDIHIRAVEISTKSMIKEIYILNFAFGIPILLFGIAFLIGGTKGLAGYRSITCMEEITPEMLDKEANAEGSKWLSYLSIYLTPTFIAGFSEGITALRYDEIAHIYGAVQNAENARDKFSVVALAMDGREYTISEVTDGTFGWIIKEQLNTIYEVCRLHNPAMECGKSEEDADLEEKQWNS